MSEDLARRVVHVLEMDGLLEPGAAPAARIVVARELAVDRAPKEAGPEHEVSAMPKLVEVVAYLGAALVLAAGFLFVLQTWDDLGDVGQVSFLAAVSAVLAVAGVFARPDLGAGDGDVRRRLSGTLLTGASLAAGVAAGVALEVFTDLAFDDVYWPGLVGGLVTALGAAVGYRLSSTAVGIVGMLGGALDVAMNLGSGLATEPSYEALGTGLSVFVVAAGWVLLAELGAFDQLRIARTLGVVAALFGSQAAAVEGLRWVGYLLFVVVAVVGVWLYLTRQDWPYLAAAVIAVTLVVPEAVSDWTAGSLGVVGGVLVAGVTLLAASSAGYRLSSGARGGRHR